MVKWIKAIVAHIKRENKSHPRRHYQWQVAPVGIDEILNFNLAAGRMVYGW